MPTRLTTTDLRFIRDNPKLSDREIAERLGFSRTYITLLRKKHGINKPPAYRNPKAMTIEAKRFILDHSEWKQKDLAKATGYHLQTINKFLNK